jgi:hypothetical protein
LQTSLASHRAFRLNQSPSFSFIILHDKNTWDKQYTNMCILILNYSLSNSKKRYFAWEMSAGDLSSDLVTCEIGVKLF